MCLLSLLEFLRKYGNVSNPSSFSLPWTQIVATQTHLEIQPFYVLTFRSSPLRLTQSDITKFCSIWTYTSFLNPRATFATVGLKQCISFFQTRNPYCLVRQHNPLCNYQQDLLVHDTRISTQTSQVPTEKTPYLWIFQSSGRFNFRYYQLNPK